MGLSTLTGVPLPLSKPLGSVAQYYGYGEGEGVLVGGKRLPKSQLKRRLR